MKLLLTLTLLTLASCAVEPAPVEPANEVNVFAQNVDRVAESVDAAEQVLICGTWTMKNLIARPVVNALKVIPFFASTPDPCEE